MWFCDFIDEGMFCLWPTAGGFLCGGLEPQPRNDECFEPTAEFILVTTDGRTERDLSWVRIQSEAPLWWIQCRASPSFRSRLHQQT